LLQKDEEEEEDELAEELARLFDGDLDEEEEEEKAFPNPFHPQGLWIEPKAEASYPSSGSYHGGTFGGFSGS
jgi:hypothetical protein